MPTEKTVRKQVVKELRHFHAVSIENGVGVGTPDVNLTAGWIEIKCLDEWPAGADTPVRVDHFTAQQRLWHAMRARAGGLSWVLLKVGGDWLLLDGAIASQFLGQLPKEKLLEIAEHVGPDLERYFVDLECLRKT